MATAKVHNPVDDWHDIVPTPQDDGPAPLVPIAYSSEYSRSMDIFRAVVKNGEQSERALRLTEKIIRMNPAHYSIWQYRAKILLEQNMDLNKELDFMDVLANEHLKNYQVWQHRKVVVTALNSPDRELDFIASSLARDAKNYHTWAYRQWVLSHFDLPQLWEGELAFVGQLLEEDVRNNSAWSHRFFVVFENEKTGGKKEDVVQQEIEFAKSKITLTPNNASPWNYLRGVLNRTQTPFSTVEPFARSILAASTTPAADDESGSGTTEKTRLPPGASLPPTSPVFAIEFLADATEKKLEATLSSTKVDRKAKLDEGLRMFKELEERDPMRKSYWIFRKQELLRKAATTTTAAERA